MDSGKQREVQPEAQAMAAGGRKGQSSVMAAIAGAVIVTLLLAVSFLSAYRIVTNIIVESNIESMRELAEHDKRTISNNIQKMWDILKGAAQSIRQQKLDAPGQITHALAADQAFLDAAHLALVDSEGVLYYSSGLVEQNEEYFALCRQYDGDFVVHYDQFNTLPPGESVNEMLVVGSKIQEFTAFGTTFQYITAGLSIDTLQNDLKIDSYNGQGYSSVIDLDGNYIVGTNRYDLRIRENFYTLLESAVFDGYSSVSEIREAIFSGRDQAFTYVLNGEKRIMVVTPMEDTDWYFVTAVPRSVFETQSNRITLIFITLIATIIVIVSLLLMLLLRSRNQRLAAESEARHREELSEALALAQQANKAKTTFLNNMSHDIRTPMNAIIGFTALATTHIDDKDQVCEYLSKIGKSSEHLLSLINDVLDMSRIESGKVKIHEAEENLSEILHSLRDIVQADVNNKQLDFFMDTVNVSDETVYCDKLRLNQVLLNILSNAIKYTAPGGTISMRISQLKVSADGYATYEFRVKDNGIGMSKEFADTIFDPFTRAESSTVSGIQGTGLGMAITKNIVGMMGGTIEVASEERKGTEVIVTVDLKMSDGHKEIEVIHSLAGLRGLVVDDDMNTCQSVAEMLRQVGMRPEWCMYGKEAVARTEEALRIGDSFFVYIIDWLMPDMNGIETTRRIRKAAGNEVPIIILTAYDWADIEKESREAGVTDFVSKPLFPSDLRRALLRCCGEAPEDEPKPARADPPSFAGKRLLLVEDNELNREIAAEILGEAGFEVETAENGLMACELLLEKGAGCYSLVLMDIQMPVMDGYKAARIIRDFDDPELAQIPIVAMTANAFEEDKQMAWEAGMNGHIAKPIDIPALFDTLKQII